MASGFEAGAYHSVFEGMASAFRTACRFVQNRHFEQSV
jgi:hypothetical protein